MDLVELTASLRRVLAEDLLDGQRSRLLSLSGVEVPWALM